MLVGHAYAGAVIAATRDEKVRALVYVAALAPDEGETVADVFYRAEPHPQAPKLAPDNHGLIYLPEEAFAAAFAQMRPLKSWRAGGSSAADFARMHYRRRRSTIVEGPANLVPRGRAGPHDLQETQRFMAERMKASAAASRRSFAAHTAPSVVVDIIREAIAEVVAG